MNTGTVKQRKGIEVKRERYELVYRGTVANEPTEYLLNQLYLKFNTDQPENFKGHSLSVSDVVVILNGERASAYYVDNMGFSELAEF